jgi:outer membrane protein assembly factor BamB/TolA-binding protein
MISAEQLLAVLEQEDLVPTKAIESFRQQIAHAGAPISADVLAKRLVEKGHLTPVQAERLLRPAAAKQPPSQKKTEPSHIDALGSSAASSGGASSGSPDLFNLLDEELPPATPVGKTGGPPLVPRKQAKRAAMSPLQPLPAAGKLAFPRRNTGTPRALAIGGAALAVVLLIAGIGLLLTSRSGGEEELREAEAAYQAGNFIQAATAYDQFLEKFPRNADAARARVHRGLCRLHQATSGDPDWLVASTLAAQIVAEIAPEPALSDSRKELGRLLATIADGLAGRVRKQPDAALMAKARQMLDLIGRYVPRSQRNRGQITDVEVVLALARRQLDRPAELGKTAAAIRQAAGQGKPQESYRLRTALLSTYPDLADDATLGEALQTAAEAEKRSIRKIERKQAAIHDEAASPIVAAVTLAARHSQGVAPVTAGQVLVAVANGAAFGLEASSGRLLWRRYVGMDDVARAELDPWPNVAERGPQELILLESDRHEVLCVEAATGRLRWRHSLGEAAAARPSVVGGKVLVPTRSGLLVIVDLASGDGAGAIQFPQPLRLPAVVDPNRPLAYLVGQQRQLYVVSLADGQCKQVFALEHGPGSVTAPPVVLGRLLLVAVNDRLRESTLHVLALGTDESPSLMPLEKIHLKGHVDVAPHCAGRRVAVATDCGSVYLFDAAERLNARPLKKVAELPAAGAEDVVRFPLLDGNRLWVADTQLTGYDLGPEGRLAAQTSSQPQSTFQQPLLVSGRVLFDACRRDGCSGLVVTAMDTLTGKQYWEICVGAPLAAGLVADAHGALTAATAAGAVFRIDAASIKDRSVVDQPLATMAGEQLDAPVGVPPTVFGGGLLVPGKAGQVMLCDLRSGRPLGDPFQPTLVAALRPVWGTPAPVGKDRFVIADDHGKLYLVGLKRDPRPHLIELAQVAAPARIVSPLAIAAGKAVYAVDATGTLAAFMLPGLQRDTIWPLEDRCTWGPAAIGKYVLLHCGQQKVWCLDGDQKLIWQADLPYGLPVGSPLPSGDHALLAFAGGVVCRIDVASGKELGRSDAGQALASGPELVDKRLFVGTVDGSLLEIKQP